MGFHWHLGEAIAKRSLTWDDLTARLGFPVAASLRNPTPPVDLSLSVLADLCQALDAQPGELLTFSPETPEEAAERELANNLSYQSFLGFKDSKSKPGY